MDRPPGGNTGRNDAKGEDVGRVMRDASGGLMYLQYIQALERHGPPDDEAPSPGHAIRHCPHCGRRSMFRLDPEGMWFECLRCHRFA
jgi:hypothetical protein